MAEEECEVVVAPAVQLTSKILYNRSMLGYYSNEQI